MGAWPIVISASLRGNQREPSWWWGSQPKYDMIWYDMIRYDMIWYDIWYMIFDMIYIYDMVWYDMIWYELNWIEYDVLNMLWYDMIWLDMNWIWCGELYDICVEYAMLWYQLSHEMRYVPFSLCPIS